MGRFIGKTVVEHRREFIENLQCGKQIGEFVDQKELAKTSPGPKTDFLGSGI